MSQAGIRTVVTVDSGFVSAATGSSRTSPTSSGWRSFLAPDTGEGAGTYP